MKNAGEYLSVNAPYFDPVADVVPFYFEWPAPPIFGLLGRSGYPGSLRTERSH